MYKRLALGRLPIFKYFQPPSRGIKENSNNTGGKIRKGTLRTSAEKHIPLPPSLSAPGVQAHPKSVSIWQNLQARQRRRPIESRDGV
jgi:hypothetical protein